MQPSQILQMQKMANGLDLQRQMIRDVFWNSVNDICFCVTMYIQTLHVTTVTYEEIHDLTHSTKILVLPCISLYAGYPQHSLLQN